MKKYQSENWLSYVKIFSLTHWEVTSIEFGKKGQSIALNFYVDILTFG